jgi:hypothetical protein
MLADSSKPEVDSRALSTVAGVDAGVLIVEGASEGVGALSTDANSVAKPVGFALYQLTKEPTVPHYQEDDMVPCLRRGRVYLKCSGTIPDGATALYIAHATGLPSAVDDSTTTPLPAGHFIKCIKGGTDGQIGTFAVNFP